jgi:hypothetical protein
MFTARLRVALVAACALSVTGLPIAGSAHGAASAPTAHVAKKKRKRCRRGFHRVHVRRHGRRVTVCRRIHHKAAPKPPAPTPPPSSSPAPPAPTGPAGPGVADVEAMLRGAAQADHEPWLGPESVEVVFDQPTQVLGVTQYDPYANDPSHAGGPIDAWPVRAWYHVVNHHDSTPEDDTRYEGCEAHLDHVWPHDSLIMVFRDATGAWTFKTATAKPGDCG